MNPKSLSNFRKWAFFGGGALLCCTLGAFAFMYWDHLEADYIHRLSQEIEAPPMPPNTPQAIMEKLDAATEVTLISINGENRWEKNLRAEDTKSLIRSLKVAVSRRPDTSPCRCKPQISHEIHVLGEGPPLKIGVNDHGHINMEMAGMNHNLYLSTGGAMVLRSFFG